MIRGVIVALQQISYKVILFAVFLVCAIALTQYRPINASATCAAQDTSRGTVTNTISVPTTGSYRVWSRLLTPDNVNNTYILEIDGTTCGIVVGGGSTIPANTWKWVDFQGASISNKINVTLTAGSHTLTLIGREDNVAVDRIVLTADTSCVPTGTGDNCANPPDTTPPTVSLTAPSNGATISNTINVNATAADDVAISKVKFYVDGLLKYTDVTSGYTYSLNTTTLTNGSHTLYAIAYDTAGTPNQTQSSSISVTVSNAATCTAGSTTAVTAPTGLTKLSSNYTTIGLSWSGSTASPGCSITGYDVYRDGTKVGSSATTSYTDTGLVADGSYTYYVVAKDSGTNTSAASANAVYTTSADNLSPNIPGSFAAASSTAATVSLSWTAPSDLPNPGGSGVAGYYIYRNGALTPTYTISNPSAVSYTDTNVTASSSYTYIISAFDNNANESSPSTSVSATTSAPTCSGTPTVPTSVRSLGSTINSITVGWNASTASTGCALSGYHMYRGGSYIGDSGSTSYTNTGLTPNTSYGYTVEAFDTSGNVSAKSTSVSLATSPDTSSPTAPTTVTATALSSSSVSLSWAASTDNVAVAGYKVYRGSTLIKTSSGTGRTYTDTTAVANTSYSYSVAAYDGANNVSTKTTASPNPITTPTSTDTTAPSVPSSPTVSGITDNQVSLGWTASTDNVAVLGYHVYINGIYSSDTASTTLALSCLVPSVTYTFTIKSFDAAGNLSGPATVNATTLSGIPGDVVCDSANMVNSTDLFMLLRNWNSVTALPSQGDLDGNAKVNSLDLFTLLRNWGRST